MKFLRYSLLLTFFFAAQISHAQRGASKPAIPKFKPPKVKTNWAGVPDSARISSEEGVNLLSQPITVFDDKKVGYYVTYYRLFYKRLGVTEDDEGKTKAAFTSISGTFKTTPLPEVWANNVAPQLKTGDELFYFDIVVKDAQGHLFSAPNFRIFIK